MASISERFRKLRVDYLHYTQDEIAAYIGVTRSTIAKLESDNSKPTQQIIRGYCLAFSVSQDWLEKGEGDIFPVQTPEDVQQTILRLANYNKKKAALIHMVVALPEDFLRMFSDQIYYALMKIPAQPSKVIEEDLKAFAYALEGKNKSDKEKPKIHERYYPTIE